MGGAAPRTSSRGRRARRAEQLMEQDDSIHYRVWTRREMLELLTAVRGRFDLDFDVELIERIKHEVVFVLRKGTR
jgi:hypothetical protein